MKKLTFEQERAFKDTDCHEWSNDGMQLRTSSNCTHWKKVNGKMQSASTEGNNESKS